MRRYSPYHSPSRRGYGGRGRSPPRRRYGGRRGQSNGSLLVRNIPMDCRPDELRVPFERFGPVRDVYIPRDYYSGEPRGFAFVEFVDLYDASEAQYHMNRQLFGGREITVVVAAETRKRPEEMRTRARVRGPSGRRSSYYGRSRSRSISRSHSPRYKSSPRRRSRSYSPAPRRRADYSASPPRRQASRSRSPRGDHPRGRDEDGVRRRSYSPAYSDGARNEDANDYNGRDEYAEKNHGDWRSSGRASGSPVGSRSRSADLSPRHSR